MRLHKGKNAVFIWIKISLSILLFGAFCLPYSLVAVEENKGFSTYNSFEAPLENTLYLGPILSYLSIENREDAQALLPKEEFHGLVAGAKVGYSYLGKGGFYASLQTKFLAGTLTEDIDANARKLHPFSSSSACRLGFAYQGLQGQDIVVIPYAGLGFSFFSEKMQQVQKNYYTTFLPVGFLVTYRPLEMFSIGFRLEWFPDLDAVVEASETLDKSRLVLSRETGQLRVDFPLTIRSGNYMALSIVPFWQKVGTKGVDSLSVPLTIPEKRRVYWGSNLQLALFF